MSHPPDAARADRAPGTSTAPSRLRAELPRILVESALIVFGLLLGLAVNEWHDAREHRARAEQALRAIAAELDSNRVLVQRASGRHRAFADTLARYLDAGTPVPERVYFGGMYNPARVLGIAWQTAREGGVVNDLPYPLVLHLARVYGRQAQYEALTAGILDHIYADLLTRGKLAAFRDNAESWRIVLRDFADREETLERQYAALLAEVRAARPRE